MKVKVAIEGMPTRDGRLLEYGSLTWPDGPVPVFIASPGFAEVVGKASGFTRDPHGVISAELTTVRELTPGVSFVIDVRIGDYVIYSDVMRINSAKIQAVIVIAGPSPWSLGEK